MSEPIHLDLDRWRRLLKGELRGEERAQILAHLETPCDACEAVLAESGELDRLDGVTDELLLELSREKRAEQPIDELAFKRVERALGRRTSVPWSLIAVAAAALIAIALFIPAREPHQTLKGTPAALHVRLEVLRAAGDRVETLARDAHVEVGTTIVFRVTLEEAACIELWKQAAERAPLLDAPACFPAGSHVLEDRGAPMGLTLREPGEVTVGVSAAQASDTFHLIVVDSKNEVP